MFFTVARMEQMIRDTGGVPVSQGAVSTWGHRNSEGVDVFDESKGAMIRQTVETLTVATGTGLVLRMQGEHSQISAGGVTWRITGHDPIEDGGLTRITLAKR